MELTRSASCRARLDCQTQISACHARVRFSIERSPFLHTNLKSARKLTDVSGTPVNVVSGVGSILIGLVRKVLPIRIALCSLWLLAVGAGFALILNHQNTRGAVGDTPQQWPRGTQIILDPNRPTLIMFAHPQCPCTRASLEELNRLMAHSPGRVAAQVVFFKPRTFSNDWAHSASWQSAAAIPGLAVSEDSDGEQARLFGAQTSGYVLLYDPHGQLLFKGGITGSRGHIGDNLGESAVVSLLAGQSAALKQTQVYGCSLVNKCNAFPGGIAQ